MGIPGCNDWPVRGRTNYPLLFDRGGQPKPAFDAVIRIAARSLAALKAAHRLGHGSPFVHNKFRIAE